MLDLNQARLLITVDGAYYASWDGGKTFHAVEHVETEEDLDLDSSEYKRLTAIMEKLFNRESGWVNENLTSQEKYLLVKAKLGRFAHDKGKVTFRTTGAFWPFYGAVEDLLRLQAKYERRRDEVTKLKARIERLRGDA